MAGIILLFSATEDISSSLFDKKEERLALFVTMTRLVFMANMIKMAIMAVIEYYEFA